MSLSQTTGKTESAQQHMFGRMFYLFGVMLVAGAIVIGIGWGLFSASLQNGLTAWIVCTVSASVAHIFSEYPQGDEYFGARLAAQMVIRTMVPFSVAIWGVKFASPPLETSLVFYILAFYLVGVMTDVQLQVQHLNTNHSQAGQ